MVFVFNNNLTFGRASSRPVPTSTGVQMSKSNKVNVPKVQIRIFSAHWIVQSALAEHIMPMEFGGPLFWPEDIFRSAQSIAHQLMLSTNLHISSFYVMQCARSTRC